jgi:hypothetical protein
MTYMINGVCSKCNSTGGCVCEPVKIYHETEKPMKKYGWECPKCGYVWALWVDGCRNCNKKKVEWPKPEIWKNAP